MSDGDVAPPTSPASRPHSFADVPVLPPPTRQELQNATIGDEIKSGAFGTVSWLDGVEHLDDLDEDQRWVMKTAKRPDEVAKLENEARFYEKLGKHDNVAQSMGMQTVDGHRGLVLEGIEGRDMGDVLKALQRLSRPDDLHRDERRAFRPDDGRALSHHEFVGAQQYLLRQTMLGMGHLRDHGVVHADLRPANVMVGKTGGVKIVDLGLAFDAGKENEARELPTHLGMVAPEQATKGTVVTSKADSFAAGEFVRKTMEGEQFDYGTGAKWDRQNAKPAIAGFGKKVGGQHQQALNERPPTQDREAKRPPGTFAEGGGGRHFVDFVNRMMHPDPEQRLSPEQALQHQLLRMPLLADDEAQELLSSVLTHLDTYRSAAQGHGLGQEGEVDSMDLNPDVSLRKSQLPPHLRSGM